MTSFTMERKQPVLNVACLQSSFMYLSKQLLHLLTLPEHRNLQKAALDTQHMPLGYAQLYSRPRDTLPTPQISENLSDLSPTQISSGPHTVSRGHT